MARILQIEDNNDIQKILRDFFSEEHEVIQKKFAKLALFPLSC